MKRTTILMALSLLSLSCGQGSIAPNPAGYVALKASLEDVNTTISRGVNDVDTSTYNRIRQAGNEISEVLEKISELESATAADANDLASEILRSTHTLTEDLRQLVSETHASTFIELNKSLAMVSGTLDGLPLVDIPAYVASVLPGRISHAPRDRRISVYGYFPELRDGGEAHVEVLGETLPLEEGSGGRLVFDLPPGQVQEETFVDLVIEIAPERGWKFWQRPRRIRDRLYVERAEPYECQLAIYGENPDWEIEIKAGLEYTDRADSSDQHVTGSVSARDLFNTTVSPARREGLDETTARIKKTGFRKWGNAACNDHCSWTSKIKSWNAGKVDYYLEAESCKSHFHSRGLFNSYQHGGGGGHANIGLKPVFLVQREDVPEHVAVDEQVFSLSRLGDFQSDLAMQDNWRIQITCEYRDGGETWSSGLVALSPQDSEEEARGINARYSDGRLVVRSTR